MHLHNYMEDVVFENLDKLLSEQNDMCKCDRCKLDIAAMVLNHVPAKYVVTQKGSIYTRLAELGLQFRADIIRELTRAIEIVRKKPNH